MRETWSLLATMVRRARRAYRGADVSPNRGRGLRVPACWLSASFSSAFGVPYIASPDLVERFRTDAMMNKPNPALFYGAGAWASHAFEWTLPFGGIGNSGSGHYRGKFGFCELSHARSVVALSEPFDGVAASKDRHSCHGHGTGTLAKALRYG
ncbi:MAG: hypothetical protein H7124_11335 [Phycisphaerales bacterium]|nr:hypothetical protein [Hyphomonadaceae bacterium]